jgi:serine/threonine protein kinase
MGEVYRARDTLLDKVVAIKTIAIGLAKDSSAQPRFERERRLAAALDHPHICRLLDAGHDCGVDYLVMEYLTGETLAARLRRGPVPLHEALSHAIEIAEALSYAHAHRIVHRDLKPANLFLTSTGIKVLDFGLAKRWSADASGAEFAQDDTVPAAASGPGVLVGTALYMAPERLEGAEADHRTDVFGFGLVVFELVTAQRAFEGGTPAALIAALMSADPPPMKLPGPAGAELEWLIRKCLAKLPAHRWQSMSDVSAILKRIAACEAPSDRPRALRWSRARLGGAAATVLVAATLPWVVDSRRPATEPPETTLRFSVTPPNGGTFTPTEGSVQAPQLSLSPDGRSILFVGAGSDGVSQLWIREFASVVPRSIPGTAGAAYPFWSHDGRSVAFFADGFLERLDLAGGPPRRLASAANGRGGSWNADGVILFAPSTTGTIRRVRADGSGEAEQTRLDPTRGDTSHRWPHFLPDGQHFLFFARTPDESDEGVYLGSLSAPDVSLIESSSVGGAYLPPNRVLFVSDGTLLARDFDLAKRRTHGDPMVIAERVAGSSNFYGAFSVSRSGIIAYANRASAAELGWFDRAGGRQSVAAARGQYVDFRLSPDDRFLAVADVDSAAARSDLYRIDLHRGSRERITSERATDASPTWSPDGTALIFRSNRERVHDLYRTAAFGASPERLFISSDFGKYPTSWSTDGSQIAFFTRGRNTRYDVWTSPVDRPAHARPLLDSPFTEVQAQFSPNGQWIAFSSDETSPSFEVVVQSLTSPERRWQASVGGGFDPRWAKDASELFYIASDGWLNSVRIHGDGAGGGPPQRLFRMPEAVMAPPFHSAYDVARQPPHFLVRIPLESIRSLPLTVVVSSKALASTP